jgi:signal transduction histidine kinase
MSLVTRFSVFFLVALALALTGFSACLYYLVGLQLSVALDEDLEATLDGFPTGLISRSERVSWAVYGDRGQRIDSSADPDRSTILDGRDLTALAVDVAMTLQGADGGRWRVLVRPMGGRHRRGPREGRRPGFGRIEEERADEQGKQEAGLPAGTRSIWPGPSSLSRDHRPSYLAAWSSLEPVEGQLRTLAAILPLISLGLWTLSAVVGQRFGRRALAPLSRLAAAARAMPWIDGAARLPSPETRDELEAFTSSFNGLLDRLHEALERQKQFTGQASHQLRTPLAGLIATIDVTRRRQRTAQEHERVLDRLHADALRLWRVLEALLFLARADVEAAMPDLEQIDLAAWVADHLVGWGGHDRALDLKGPETCPEPITIRAHPALLGQLLDNLLENACKYSPPGSSIHVNLQTGPGVVVLSVEDRGCGISAADLPHVFEPFYRSQQAPLGQGGVGLGMAVVQRIASAHGGTIDVQSEPAVGSCFTLRLPAVEHSATTSAQITIDARKQDFAAQVT